VIAQSVIAIFILHSAFNFIVRQNALPERGGLVFLGLMVFLAFGTTLPWFVGQIMPDVFTGLSLLSLFLLLYDSNISLKRTLLISAVLCISIGTHITHLLTLTLLLLAIFVLRTFGAFREFWPTQSTKGIVACVLVPIMAVTALLALSNWRSGFGFALSPGKPVFLFGRLIESGLAADYLQQRCEIEQFTPCKYLHNLPKTSEEFLWGSHPLLKEMGGWSGATGEASRIVSATIWHYPVRFVVECVRQMFRQFFAFTAGSGNYPIRTGPEFEGFRELYPGDVAKYLLSRQSIGKLAMDAYRVTPVYAAVFWCSFGVSLMALFTRRLRVRMANQLFVLTLIFLFANALATGALSGVNDRYQARASWLMGLCCAAYVIPYVLRRRKAHLVVSGRLCP
jgi:ABC-type multidrug transport system fused ATPase/permease subunit